MASLVKGGSKTKLKDISFNFPMANVKYLSILGGVENASFHNFVSGELL